MAEVQSLDAARKSKAKKAKMPTGKQLESLASTVGAAKAQMDEQRGEMGAAIKNASNDHNIHKKAFKLALQIRRMEDTEASAMLAHFDHYREQMKLDRAALPLAEGEG